MSYEQYVGSAKYGKGGGFCSLADVGHIKFPSSNAIVVTNHGDIEVAQFLAVNGPEV